MTTRKTFLFVLAFCCMYLTSLAQSSVDSTTIYRENFDGATYEAITTYTNFAEGDWVLDSSLSVSNPACIHLRMFNNAGNMNLTTSAIPLSSNNMSDQVRRVYLMFDHICKVSDLDVASIYYRTATGMNDDGTYIWGSYRLMNFSTSSSYYYGDGQADPYGTRTTAHFGTYTAGKFNHAAYGTGNNGLWKPNQNTAVPNNTWWRHEILDITHFVLDSNVTHIQIQFRVNKNSPSTSGTEDCAGWFVDNLTVLLSNCELEVPRIALSGTVYAGGDAHCGYVSNNMKNNTGPYLIESTIRDNDTLNVNTLLFTYQKNSEPLVTLPNNITFNQFVTGSNFEAHQVISTWQLPDICYYDTIRYHIYIEDVHGNKRRLDTFLIAWHDQTNIQTNDCRADSINSGQFPHCFLTGVAQPVKFYFTNKSDALHSEGNPYQTSLSVVLKVENENHQVTHNSTHSWTGSICMDVGDTLSLGSFIPTQGYNYITAYITTRNGQLDGYHANDTIRFTGFACDSLLSGNYTVGGTNPDFADMNAVKTALSYCGVKGPTTFHFRPGTYQDFDFTENYVGQSEINTITFQGDNRDQVIINNNHTDAGSTLYGAVTLVHVSNFHFKNMTINGNSSAQSKGVLFRDNGSSNISFDNCKILANPTNTTDVLCFAVGRNVGVTNANGNTPDNNISFNNCILSGGNFGVYYIGINTRRNAISFTNNRIVSCYKGIHTLYCNPIILNNHISQSNMGSHQNFTGIYVEQAMGPDINGNTIDSTYDAEYGIQLKNATNNDFYIRNNHVKVGNSNFGIYVTNSSSTATMTGYVYNNEVILYPVTADNSYAMQITSCNNLKVTNNSFYIKSDAPYTNTAALMIQNNNNTYLDNNILLNYCNTTTSSAHYPLYLNGTSTVTGSQNDLISAAGTIVFKTAAMNTIADMERNISTMHNNISLLPPMANPTESLLPTDFNGLECTRNADVTSDIRNIERTNPTYMGAYANMIPAVDAAITEMTSPSLGECPQGSYNITLTVSNKGSQTLNFANNPATVIIHSDSLNLTQQSTINSGSVNIMESMPFVVANNVTIPTNQPMDLTFIIHTNGDNNTSNDTLRMNFILEVAKPDYDETFSNGTQQTWTIQQISTGNMIGNWTFQEGTSVNPTIAPVYGTGRLFFNSKNFPSGTSSRAIMPVIDLTGTVHPILEMWFAHDRTGNANAAEGVTVKISTNNGATFTAIAPQGQSSTLVKRYNANATEPLWALYTYDLTNYVNAGCIYIAFDADGKAGNNINIDRIRLRNLVDDDIAITQIYARGESPNQYNVNNVVKALARNEGRLAQNNIKVYLTVTGATEQYQDSLVIPSLASGAQTIITFPDHHYNVQEMKNVEVRSRQDQLNSNNAINWAMNITENVVNYADTGATELLIADYNNIIRPCVRYTTDEEIAVTAVKYFYDQSYIANPENGFKAFVSNADGQIITTSDIVSFDNLQQGAWNIIPINNFALTNMNNEFYVGIEMLAKGDYLCAQVETPLRDSAFYYLESNGTYTPQTTGRFMIGAVIDTPFVHDLALLSLDNPTTRCDLGHENLVLTITNNGSQDLLPGTVMHYSINGLPAVSETMTDTLRSHETSTFRFNTQFDFTNDLIEIDSNYSILVWATKDAQDRLQYNDTLAQSIVSRGKSNVPTVQDTVNISYYHSGTLTAHLPSSIQQGVIGWFANTGYESWEFLGYTDSTFQTPVTFFDTTFYANANPGYIFDTIVGALTGSTTGNGAQPFVFTKGYSRGRMLYTENEIGQHGPITTIGVYVNSITNVGAEGIPIKLYLKKTSLASFPSTAAIDWDNEVLGATLIVDEMVHFDHVGWHYFNLSTPFNYDNGNLIVLTETNCADYCTGTGTQCNNCGTYVSGGTGYPNFRQTNCPTGFVQYKDNNTLPMTGNYSNYTKRLTMSFKIADLECGSQKVPIHIHVPDIPTYDVKTMSLEYPTSGCHIYNEHIQVLVKNMLNMPIPAGKVNVHAIFNNGTVLTQTVNEVFGSEESKLVTFDQTYDFSAPHNNITFDYVIYTTMNNEPVVYSGNDTITGQLTSTYTAGLQESYTYVGNYTQSMQILQPADRLPSDVQTYYFFDNNGTQIHSTTTSVPYYTTPALYDSVVYWVQAKTKTSNCMTDTFPIFINVAVPDYDIKTDLLVDPVSYQCGVNQSYPVKVQVTNTDTSATGIIPAGTFNLTAQFTGTQGTSHNANGNVVINQPINSLDSLQVTFANGLDIGSQTQNRIYNYTIFSNATDANTYVYRLNDTISGTLYVPAYPTTTPETRTFTNTNYGQPYTVNTANFTNSPYTYYYFYHNATDEIPFAQGHGFTTEPLYSNVQYYYSGRIESPAFEDVVTVGTGTQAQSIPFQFTAANSYARILYTSDELGGHPGRIDTILVRVKVANTNAGTSVPVKIWMRNANDTVYNNTVPPVNWTDETNNSKLVFDGNLAFEHTEWYAIPIQGGFDYDGRAIYIYTQHDCDGGSCLTNYGISTPQFYGVSASSVKKVLVKTTNNFGWNSFRWNTRFKFSYTCESPKGILNINTAQRAHDLHVVDIITPTTPNNDYTATETVQATIINHGTSNESNFPVKYQLDNGTAISQNYSGTLASGATGTITFNTPVDLSSIYFATPFKVYADLTTDTYHNNDTVTIFVRKPDPTPASSPTSTTAGLHITNVTFAGINNGNPSPFKQHPRIGEEMYSDFTLDPTQRGTIVKGQRYPLSVYHSFENNTSIRTYKAVYIDYNRDNVFSTNERITPAGFNNTNLDSLMFLYVTIPDNAETGLTRMRVICSNANIQQATGYYTQGETEDYAINILPPYENDMGITSYVHPIGNVCPDAEATMRIWVKNYGSQTQTFTESNTLTVTSTVRTGATTNTYNTQLTSGSVAPGDSIIAIINPVNLSAIGSYTISSRITYAPDQYAHNDTLSTWASTDSLQRILNIPFFEDFDHNTGTTIDNIHFTDDWILDQQNLSYVWTINQGAAENNPQAGPASDHTQQNNSGRYATVPGPGSPSLWATLTSRCINMHYNHEYPVELSFYQHFFGVNNASFKILVQVGSGENFITIDTLTKADGGQTSSGSLWSQYRDALIGFDEVAQLRFKIMNHSGKIDPSIDDINLKVGVPSIKLESVLYPNADECLNIGDTIYPQVVIRNVGLSPIRKFDLTTTMSVGNDLEVKYDTIEHLLMPDESMTYSLSSGFVLEFPSPGVDFTFRVHIDYELDEDTLNNKKHVLSCTNWSVPEIDDKDGVILMQNDPNPAITTTRIAYKLPEAGTTTLNIYSAAGQLLYSDSQDALEGENHYDVNTSNLAAGIYFYTLRFKDIVLTKKMVIQK